MNAKENTEASKLFSALTTLITLVTVVGVLYLLWLLAGAILYGIGVVFMVAFTTIEMYNLLKKTKEPIKEPFNEFVKGLSKNIHELLNEDKKSGDAMSDGKKSDDAVSEEDSENFTYFILGLVTLVYLGYCIVSVMFIYYFSQMYLGTAIAALGLLLVVLYSLKTLGVLKGIYKTIETRNEVPKHKNFKFKVMYMKWRSALALTFIAMLLLASFGFVF